MAATITHRIDELTASRVPFVQATVVRAQAPSAARPGDRAVILADGSIEGFVGGHCAAGSVRAAALGALDSGEAVLLRVLPDGDDGFPESPGASIAVNPCLSGGALEIYLEPLLPPPVVHVVGASPIAEAVASLARDLGYGVGRDVDGAGPAGAWVAVVSSHGDEESAVRRALDAGAEFVGVVCSRTRGRALLQSLAMTDAEASRVHVHVGVEIGARTPAEIAVSIMAAVVRSIRLEGPDRRTVAAPARPLEAVDPVCGMTVTVGPDTPHAVVDGVDVWFCHSGCRDRFLAGQGT
jgi:xanthine dehydrogenase accessory factor